MNQVKCLAVSSDIVAVKEAHDLSPEFYVGYILLDNPSFHDGYVFGDLVACGPDPKPCFEPISSFVEVFTSGEAVMLDGTDVRDYTLNYAVFNGHNLYVRMAP